MKRLILLLILLVSANADAVNVITVFGTASAPPPVVTPIHSYTLDAAGGTNNAQVYDSITGTWRGGGADTVSFANGYLEANSVSDRCYIPGSDLEGPIVTIEVEYQVSSVLDAQLYPLYFAAGGDEISYQHLASNNIGAATYRADYGTPVVMTFSNAGMIADTWYKAYFVIDTTGNDLYVYVNGSLGDSEINNGAVVDQGSLGNFYIGFVNSGTNVVRNRNLKIYDQIVTP